MLADKLRQAAAEAGIQYVGGYAEGFAGTTSDITITFGGNLTGGIASSASAGDIVIVGFCAPSGTNQNWSIANFTELADLYVSFTTYTQLYVGFKVMPSTPDSSFILPGGTSSTSIAGAVVVSVWRGVDPVTPIDTTTVTATGTGTSYADPPAITPITANAMVLAVGAAGRSPATGYLYSSSDLDHFISAWGTDNIKALVGIGAHKSSTTFNPSAFFVTSDMADGSWASATLALRPA